MGEGAKQNIIKSNRLGNARIINTQFQTRAKDLGGQCKLVCAGCLCQWKKNAASLDASLELGAFITSEPKMKALHTDSGVDGT